jgi:hypothetical protein
MERALRGLFTFAEQSHQENEHMFALLGFYRWLSSVIVNPSNTDEHTWLWGHGRASRPTATASETDRWISVEKSLQSKIASSIRP